MCDYSLKSVASRPAKVGDKLVTTNFGTGTTGFASCENKEVAVCVLPGTEIAFDEPMKSSAYQWFTKAVADMLTSEKPVEHKVAIFRQINTDEQHTHHDALETPDGKVTLLTGLECGQQATVLQLPAQPKTEQEAKEQTRLEIVA